MISSESLGRVVMLLEQGRDDEVSYELAVRRLRDYVAALASQERAGMKTLLPLHDIVTAVEAESGLSREVLSNATRVSRVTRARHALFWLARRYTAMTFAEIGDGFGGRDHSTVMHGCANVDRERLSGGGPRWDLTRRAAAKLGVAV